jgi:hypothetical protein
MTDSLPHLLSFGTVFGGLLGLVPCSIALKQGKTPYALAALMACTIIGATAGEKMALPVFSSLSVVAIVRSNSR